MKSRILITAFLVTSLFSCQHNDYEEPIAESPAFTLSGLRNGEPFTLSAGENGLVQTASLTRNKFGVMEWASNFVNSSCTGCDPTFTLSLNDRENENPQSCADFQLFESSQLLFATSPSTSAWTSGALVLSDVHDAQDISFTATNSTIENTNEIEFLSSGPQQITTQFELDSEDNEDENEIHIHQTVYAGDHIRLSAPFLYEILENDPGEEQRIKLHMPNLPDLRGTHWDINGSESEQETITLDIPQNQLYRIELFFIHDESGNTGSFSLQFNHGFPVNSQCDEEDHIMPAPHIHMDWETSMPNYEKVFITYRFDGKTYTSVSPMNEDGNSSFEIVSVSDFTPGIQGNPAKQVRCRFNASLVEEGNPSNVLELTDCTATFGFTPNN
jgi:hypothetical protein